MELAHTRKSVPLPVGAMAGYFGGGNAMGRRLPGFERPCMSLRLLQFSFGILLCGISIAMLVRAGLGLGPWDVFHEGGAARTGLSFGTVLVLTGIAVLLAWIPLRQKPGWGTLLNQLGVGLTADFGLWLLPETDSLVVNLLLLLGGILLQGIGSAAYIGVGLGPGPRDGLMTGIVARTGWTVRSVRTGIELSALSLGWLLGGTIGFGTLLYAVTIGPVIHVALPWFDWSKRKAPAEPATEAA